METQRIDSFLVGILVTSCENQQWSKEIGIQTEHNHHCKDHFVVLNFRAN